MCTNWNFFKKKEKGGSSDSPFVFGSLIFLPKPSSVEAYFDNSITVSKFSAAIVIFLKKSILPYLKRERRREQKRKTNFYSVGHLLMKSVWWTLQYDFLIMPVAGEDSLPYNDTPVFLIFATRGSGVKEKFNLHHKDFSFLKMWNLCLMLTCESGPEYRQHSIAVCC